jgi:hypothetical protein
VDFHPRVGRSAVKEGITSTPDRTGRRIARPYVRATVIRMVIKSRISFQVVMNFADCDEFKADCCFVGPIVKVIQLVSLLHRG